jgi:hypothetical protein
MENNFFVKKPILCVKNSIAKIFSETDHRFGILDPNYLWSNFIKKKVFRKKSILGVKKSIAKKHFEKLITDSNSSPSINFGQVLWKMTAFVFTLFLDQSLKCGHTSKQSSKQFILARLFSTRKRTDVFNI